MTGGRVDEDDSELVVVVVVVVVVIVVSVVFKGLTKPVKGFCLGASLC